MLSKSTEFMLHIHLGKRAQKLGKSRPFQKKNIEGDQVYHIQTDLISLLPVKEVGNSVASYW